MWVGFAGGRTKEMRRGREMASTALYPIPMIVNRFVNTHNTNSKNVVVSIVKHSGKNQVERGKFVWPKRLYYIIGSYIRT